MKAKNAVASRKRKKKVLQAAKGYWGERSKHYRRAKESVRRAGAYMYRDRRNKKRTFRSLWITRINAAAREHGLTYRELIAGLKAKKIILSRDMLAQIASEEPHVFGTLVSAIKKK